jgi:type I restriction-modification system DNA methylase subunit
MSTNPKPTPKPDIDFENERWHAANELRGAMAENQHKDYALSLLQDRFPDLKADYALMNPPFNISNWHPELLPDQDPRLFGPKDTFTAPGNAKTCIQ